MSSTRRRRRHPTAPSSGLLAVVVLLGGCEPAGDRFAEIHSLHREGRFEASLHPLEELLAARPDDPELLTLYGVANMQSDRPSLALWPLREAREHPEWALRAGAALARAALATGDHGAAIEAASRVLEREPDHRDLLALRAEAQLRSNHFEDALADADRLLAVDPQDPDARIARLRCLIGLRRLDEAEAAFSELEGRWSEAGSPKELGDRYCAARALFAEETDLVELAEERFEECLKLFPTGSIAIREAVGFYDEQRRPDRATEILRTALEHEPVAPLTRETLAARLRAAGNAEEAERILLAGTELGPVSALQAWGGLATHYFQLQRFEAGVGAWQKVLELAGEPGSDLLFGYAEALVRARRHQQALEVAAKLPDAHAELIRGLSLLEQGRPKEALERYAAGLRLWPNHAVGRYYAALAAERIGDFDRAIEEYRQSLRSGAGQSDAGVRLARIHEAEGAYEPAWQALVLHLEAQPGDPEGRLLALRIAARLRRWDRFNRYLAALGWSPQEAYERVAAADREDAESRRAAELAAAAGDRDEARRRLEELLGERPYDAAAAVNLAELLLETGADPERARSLARQAVRFRGGPRAYAVLADTEEALAGRRVGSGGG